MPSAIIEQIRQQFYASMGINEWTPISDDQATMLIDQWEQYLYSASQQMNPQGQYPPAPRPPLTYVPPGQRPYVPGAVVASPPAPGFRLAPGIPVGIRPVAIAPPARGLR